MTSFLASGFAQTPVIAEGAVALSGLRSVLRARGADAASFLQGQLTNDVASLDATHARLAGYCSAKGRLLASFVVWRPAPDELLLACSADLAEATLKRLRMFVLRAQCRLDDATAEVRLVGLAGNAARAWLGASAPAQAWNAAPHAGGTVIRLPAAGAAPRFLWAAPAGTAALPAGLPTMSLDAWRWLEVQSGVATIEAATADRFVPQMLNYEVLGGIDFRKGCYPGQEVVARSQYRGTLKRRSFLFTVEGPAGTVDGVRAGQEVFHDGDPGQPAGQVVNAAAEPAVAGRDGAMPTASPAATDGDGATPAASPAAATSSRWLALVELKFATLEAGTLHLGAADGPVLERAAMPYEVPLQAADPA